jgi:hypothetical protein
VQIHGHRSGSILELERRLSDTNVSLRWGGNQVVGAINGQAHLLDGLEQLELFDAKSIPCPDFSVTGEILTNEDLWLARKRNHSQGKDIIPVGAKLRKRRDWRDSDFFVKYVPNVVREWRFHILAGKCIARATKVWAGNGPEPTVAPIIRSRRLGWHMRHDLEPHKSLRKVAKAAVKAVGYELGAVDLLELNDGSAVVLEVNSRPAIRDEYTLAAYAAALRAYVHLER